MKKKELRDLRIRSLELLIQPLGFEIRKFSESHFRIFGPTVVDYWPGTGRCWLTGSNDPSVKMEPFEVIQLVSAGLVRPSLQAAAERSLDMFL